MTGTPVVEPRDPSGDGVAAKQPTRERTYAWEDPAASAGFLGRSSGLEFFRAMERGELPPPPIMRTLDFRAVEVEAGRIVFAITPAEYQYNPLGTVHGGVVATLLDSAAGCAVHSALPAGVAYTSLDLTVKFLRPVTGRSGELRCEGTVLHLGSRTALAQARLTDSRGALVAYASSTCLVFPVPEPAP